MMSLVAQYSDSSDEQSDQEDTEATQAPPTIPKPIANSSNSKVLKLPAPKVSHKAEVLASQSEDRSMFMSLPAPKSDNVIEEDICDIPTVKIGPALKQKVKITIPSLSDFKDDEDSAPKTKKMKPVPKGSGLLSLLPEPKNLKPSGAMLPYSLTRRPVPKKPPPPKKKTVAKPIVSGYPDSDESGDETEHISTPSSGIDFFSLTCQSAPEPADINLEDLLPPVSGPKSRPPPPPRPAVEVQEVIQEWSQETAGQEEQEQNVQLNDEALRQLCGRRVERGAEEVNMIELHGDNMMPDPKDWMLKQMTEEQEAHGHRSSQPNSSHKRKHQITYLAFQAKEREIELKNQWSMNRMTKKQTQAKYGF